MIRAAALSCFVLAVSALSASAASLTLGTATPGGSFPAFGEALVEAFRESDPGLTVELRNTKGSAENLTLLKEGQLDLALVQGEYAYDALGAQDGSRPGLAVVAPVDTSPGVFVVTAASPIRSVEDLRGKTVALGTRASGLTVIGRTVLKGSGIDPDRDITPVLLDHAGAGAGLVRDGSVAALWGAGFDWPSFKVLAGAPGGARFFGPDPGKIAAILALRASLRRLTIPARSFEGQEEAIETVGSWSFVIARPGLPDEAVARFVQALDRGREALARRYRQGRESDPRNLVSAVPLAWLHPATAAYLNGLEP
ncbi:MULTISPECIES: TAXI family TRAP transporter solute-binding subunit [Methylobacterium]|uniref:C4-dicarboxylate ABC transporter substrate-binding protein n=1 Tax=Methylobacterium jeotgali TaxID=381630 RepID=A0ABQ4SWT1_9HYPH|nr:MULTISPECIES: TAXI family TRAP transporter solute-binding subunit [Methylobacterium]PIU08094.1 MAG: C4-dicarboxylate ABC transporter substrate-binding protein [Methylobacterium sp. CG09_land_8_20_14_0_10_71_15]PIU15548.1 MAG: C4-dicarboxylate ABC transporter substrate-binding protein [Methylobacterium sp. CG08_land_8_20_14_0_20_71_15]GBU17570.1 hypothetical protein AwMethylo_17850 [Methylobacterium sp.]GJE07664.1 hypothetical protein AOPFMNJM_2993 [Methylobacterium jeotgali]